MEHTVTELITGYNLVELGIRAAQGEDLPLSQSDIAVMPRDTVSIKCRISQRIRT